MLLVWVEAYFKLFKYSKQQILFSPRKVKKINTPETPLTPQSTAGRGAGSPLTSPGPDLGEGEAAPWCCGEDDITERPIPSSAH